MEDPEINSGWRARGTCYATGINFSVILNRYKIYQFSVTLYTSDILRKTCHATPLPTGEGGGSCPIRAYCHGWGGYPLEIGLCLPPHPSVSRFGEPCAPFVTHKSGLCPPRQIGEEQRFSPVINLNNIWLFTLFSFISIVSHRHSKSFHLTFGYECLSQQGAFFWIFL